ncbi:4641_t:CDS:2, partial [Acaulospora morrowiae]
ETGHSNVEVEDQALSELSTEEIKDSIIKYGKTVAGLKQSITRSRKLVYKAANDPNILEFAPHMIAYQLTLIESAIFLEIDPQSLLTHSPKNPDPKITASTDFFNYLTRVVERSILLSLEASSRAQTINHWVKVAVKLHELHNFQTLKAILAALGTPPIKRLKRTWACIPKKSMVRLENLNELMSETRNYEKYRETIQRDGFLRKPTVPFLGTFIMDATYLLAAVKTVGSSNSSVPANVQSPRTTTAPMSPVSSPTSTQVLHDDPRIQELLQTLCRYQNGPKYHPNPPASYIKASTKHHFRTASISAALHRSGSKYNHRNDDDDETIEEKQQLITHYMLTRVWIPERSVDELSSQREPHVPKFYSGRTSNPASWGGTPSNISNTSVAYRGSTGSTVGGSGTSTGGNTSTSSGMGRTSSTSGSGDSRPQSLEDGIDVTSTNIRSDKAGPTPDKENKTRDEKEKEEKTKQGELEKDTGAVDDEGTEESPKNSPESIIAMPFSGKRNSWRIGMRVMFGGNETGESPKTHTTMLRSASHSRSSSNTAVTPKSHIVSKIHGRPSSVNSSDAKPFTYTSKASLRRSLEEPHSSTPPPLFPKPVSLTRSASTSSATSMGSSASANGTLSSTRNSIGNGNLLHGGTNIDGLEDIRIALAKKVASEVAAGGGTVERNWK